MPVAKKTNKKKTTKSRRQPSTVTVNASTRSRNVSRSRAATVVTVGGRRGASDIAESKTTARSTKRKSGKDHGDLPTWGKLESKANRKIKSAPRRPFLDAVPTVRFALVLALVAAAFTLYVGHVHATQEVLAKTQQARKDNHRLHLKYNRVKGEYDGLTGPAAIHRRASVLGLIEDAAYGRTIIIDD